MKQATFPVPRKLGEICTRWALSELLAYEAERDGKEPPPELAPENERYLSAGEVAGRYGASLTSVWRWARNAKAEGVAA
jgi:predicted DNA-binding transcriptional regulator AlpA